MGDYSKLGLDKFLRPFSALSTKKNKPATQQEISQVFNQSVKAINISRPNFPSDFIRNTSTATGTASFGTGTWLTIDISLVPRAPDYSRKQFGFPYVSIYEGTSAVGSMEIFPAQGNGITFGDYRTKSGFDLNQYDGTISSYTVSLENVAAGNVNIYIEAAHAYLAYNTRLSSSG